MYTHRSLKIFFFAVINLSGTMGPEVNQNEKIFSNNVKNEEIHSKIQRLEANINFVSNLNNCTLKIQHGNLIPKKTRNVENANNQILRVGGIYLPPLNVLKEVNGTTIFRGLNYHLFSLFSQEFNASFKVVKPEDGELGRYVNKSWTGMMAQLLSNETDLAVGLVATSQRRAVVNLSPALYSVKFVIVYKPIEQKTDYDIFLEPYNKEIWFSIFVINMLAIFMYMVARLFFKSKKAQQNFLSLCWPIVLKVNTENEKKGVTRFCLGVYLFFSKIILEIFTSLLTSLLAITKVTLPFHSLQDLVERKEYYPMIIKGGALTPLFEKSPFNSVKLLLALDIEDGFRASVKDKIGFITLAEEVAEFNKNCSLSVAPNIVMMHGLSLAYKPQFPHTELFNHKIVQLREFGLMQRLRLAYVPIWHGCSEGPSYKPATLSQIIGPLLLLLSAVLLSIIIGIIEKFFKGYMHNY